MPKNFARKSAKTAKKGHKDRGVWPPPSQKKFSFVANKTKLYPQTAPGKETEGKSERKGNDPPETENKGIFAQDKARKKRERRRTYLRKVLPYTSNFSSNLCRCVFLASEPWRRKTLQYTSHLYCSTPPVCTAMIRPLLWPYLWESRGGPESHHSLNTTPPGTPIGARNPFTPPVEDYPLVSARKVSEVTSHFYGPDALQLREKKGFQAWGCPFFPGKWATPKPSQNKPIGPFFCPRDSEAFRTIPSQEPTTPCFEVCRMRVWGSTPGTIPWEVKFPQTDIPWKPEPP